MPLAKNGTRQYRFKRKYKINHNYFNKIDNERKAYWLGFLMADGYVQYTDKNHSGRVCIHLQERDINILEKFNKDLKSNYPIKVRKNGYRKNGHKIMGCILEFRSHQMTEDLRKLGCINKKSLKLKFPKIIKKLESHFIRGYFDGDGSICRNGCMGNVFKIIGTLQFITKVQKILVRECKLNFTKLDIHKNGITNIVRYNGQRQLNIIFNYLYTDASLFLERKKLAW